LSAGPFFSVDCGADLPQHLPLNRRCGIAREVTLSGPGMHLTSEIAPQAASDDWPQRTGAAAGVRSSAASWTIGTLAALLSIVLLLFTLMYASLVLNSGIRGYSAGESQWSKGRKEAAHQLERYLLTGDESRHQAFHRGLAIPLADHRARLEMESPEFDFELAYRHLVAGDNHPDDVPTMIYLYRWFGWQPQFARAIEIWAEADRHIVEMDELGTEIQLAHRQQLMTPAYRSRLHQTLDRIDRDLVPLEAEFSIRLGEAARWTQSILAFVLLSSTAVLLILAASIVRRTTARGFKARTFEAEERFRKTFEAAPVGILHLTRDGTLTQVNRSFCEMLGYTEDALVGARERAFAVSGRAGIDVQPLPLSEARSGVISGERRYRHADGREIDVQINATLLRNIDGEPVDYVVVAQDVTESRRLAKDLSHRASHDPLTGLLNRYEFERRLRAALADAGDQDELSVLFLDLDQFKAVNDSSGHLAGDRMLTQVAAVIRGCLQDDHSFARLGGDEFGILLRAASIAAAQGIADRIRSEIAAFRFTWEGQAFSLGVSIGLVSATGPDQDVTRLLSAADAACYRAKSNGRNQVHVSTPDEVNLSHHRTEMEWLTRVQAAQADSRLQLVWQPIVPAGFVIGEMPRRFEALLRMRDPDGSIVLPGSFIRVAERYGRMVELDCWVLNALLDWLDTHLDQVSAVDEIHINVSGAAMVDRRYVELAERRLARSAFGAERICLEVTETQAISNMNAAIGFMEKMRRLGCRFALDDFGIGASSFAYLNALPVDYIKIDGAFVHDVHRNSVHEAITRCINDVAHSMGKRTVAEFAATGAVLERLKGLGCDYAQGNGIGVARPLGDFSFSPTVALAA
jgi:diguanylate cyclase (GGDEF)-like protein/PAS domain S-box-containing protein